MADLVTEDSRRYNIVMEEGSSTQNTWIDGGSRMMGEVNNGATIKIEGTFDDPPARQHAMVSDSPIGRRGNSGFWGMR